MSVEELQQPLPEAVRQRLVALASEALGALPGDQVPTSLRRVAKFAPARRARLGAADISAGLEASAAFRQQVAERADAPDADGDVVERAVRAYLLRPEGWQAEIEVARTVLADARDRTEVDRATSAAARLREQVSLARAEARAERDRLRAEIDRIKSENMSLRRKLGEAREVARAATAAAARDTAAAREAQERAETARAGAEAEARRLRGRLTEAESALEGLRRGERAGRSLGTTRLRLLLDAVTDAAGGLRRELALPPVDVRPGDSAGGLAPSADVLGDSPARALPADDPALLDEFLRVPQVHLVVDGYNVTKLGWPSQSLEGQRAQLVGKLAALAARTGAEVTVVFDGADLRSAPPPVSAPRGVRVRFSPPDVIADDVIRQLVRAEPEGRPVVVVSSDREVMEGVRRAGVRPVPSSALVQLLGR